MKRCVALGLKKMLVTSESIKTHILKSDDKENYQKICEIREKYAIMYFNILTYV